MTHMSRAHPAHRMRTPRGHRDATLRHTVRATETGTNKREWISAQTIFYIARGVAILLAAAAVGLSAVSDDAEKSAATYIRPLAVWAGQRKSPRAGGRAGLTSSAFDDERWSGVLCE